MVPCKASTAEESAGSCDDEGIFQEEKDWPWEAVKGAPEPTTGCLTPWANVWPPPWWPLPLLKGWRGSVRKEQEKQHGKFFGATEAVHTVKVALRAANGVGSSCSSGTGLGHADFAAGSVQGHCLRRATPRRGRRVGLGDQARQKRTLLLEESLTSEWDFPDPSTTMVPKLMLLNWNAGNLVRNPSLIDFVCGPFSLCLLQESSTTLGQSLAESRAICWSDASDGQQGCLSVLAGASGRKVVVPTYGSDFSGKIFRPYKKHWKKGERLLAACMYTADVSWLNKHGDLVRRAGLDFWRVTTFHMDHVEAKSGENGSGGLTLAAVFGLAMRDKHRLVAGDFNRAQCYLCRTLDRLISEHRQYAGITYEYLESPLSAEIGLVILNYPDTVAITGEVKFRSFEKDSEFWQTLGLRETDTDAHFPQVVMIYEKAAVGCLTSGAGGGGGGARAARKLCHNRSLEGEMQQKRNKRKRPNKKKEMNKKNSGHDTAVSSISNARECSDSRESKATNSGNSLGSIRFVAATEASGSGSDPLAFQDGRSRILAESLEFMCPSLSDSSDDANDMSFE